MAQTKVLSKAGKKVFCGNKQMTNVIRDYAKSASKAKLRKLVKNFDCEEGWHVYGDVCTTDYVVSAYPIKKEGYRLLGIVQPSEDTFSEIWQLKKAYAENLYCCKSTALKMTKDAEILNKAYVGETKNPHYSCASPMQLFNRYYIEYFTSKQ